MGFDLLKFSAGPLLHEAEAADSAVLSFDAYADEEGVDEEIHRIRIFKINYHLNDDTITVNEPFVDNTGYLHVCLSTTFIYNLLLLG